MLVDLLCNFLKINLKKFRKNKLVEAILKVVELWVDSDFLIRMKESALLKILLNLAKTISDLVNFWEHKVLFTKILTSI